MNQMITALILVALTVAGGAWVYKQAQAAAAADPRPPYRVSFVGYYNESHSMFYVVHGCLEDRVAAWDPASQSWVPVDRACEGSLILARLDQVVEGLPDWEAEVVRVEG